MGLVNFWRKKKGNSEENLRQVEPEKLFDSQLETLKYRGVSEDILKVFLGKREMVVEKVKNMHIPERRIPFLPIIPREFLTVFSQMLMVHHTDKEGVKKTGHVSNLNPNGIRDIIEVPKIPYYIFGVENNLGTLGKTPQEVTEYLKYQNRSGLTDCEIISLCIHTATLSQHGIYAVNSHYGHGYEVMSLFLNNGNETPEFGRWSISKAHKKCCSASCHPLRI